MRVLPVCPARVLIVQSPISAVAPADAAKEGLAQLCSSSNGDWIVGTGYGKPENRSACLAGQLQ